VIEKGYTHQPAIDSLCVSFKCDWALG